MHIKNLSFRNFRGIRYLNLDFEERKNILFVGENGAGKSTILDGVNILLSWLTARIKSPNGNGHSLSQSDITVGENSTLIQITITYKELEATWSLARTRFGQKKEFSSNLTGIRTIAQAIQESMNSNDEESIPVICHYGVHRAVFDPPLRIRQKHSFDQLDIFDEEQSEFRLFFEWFRNREDIENEEKYENLISFLKSINSDNINSILHQPELIESYDLPHYQDHQLKAVRTAIYAFLPGYTDLRIRRRPQMRMVIKKDDSELEISQLSDGEKCLIAMIGDLARRLAMANPISIDPLKRTGIVLIDEIDLHLHPNWQRRVLPSLKKAFPNILFILTTHSPQVLSETTDSLIFLLSNTDSHIEASILPPLFGKDSNKILADFMNSSERNIEVKSKIERLYTLISEGVWEEVTRLKTELKNILGPGDPDLVYAEALEQRKRVIKR
ncbi:AAA family ATPase [Heliobacterium undosum]|uniref:AAA family ATPase n=1 Tax=Heliomicrobium undosum TaxID=121734 RepID=A0A845KXN9_9FIRM|nr:AAA family ATPase [Heliomicrobium undosum]MZP28392.1 AAA family ATPase [Heliomicrobium undosum]